MTNLIDKDTMNDSADFVNAVGEAVNSGELKDIAGAVQKIAPLAMVAIPPPAGIFVGGAINMIAGLTGTFLGGKSEAEKLYDKLAAGQKKILDRIGDVERKME